MIDVQNQPDKRKVALRKVGVKNLVYPITVLDRREGVQHTVATANLYADLPHHLKGTHMSRFIEVFDKHQSDLSMPRFLTMLEEIRLALGAQDAFCDLSFPYFMVKKAPVSGQESMMRYDAGYYGKVWPGGREFQVRVQVPIQTVCPCSKAISDYGAHNQRGVVTLTVALGPFFWIEDLVALVEDSASSGLYTLLKREDEKYITEKAFDNPRFVEDLVREVYLKVAALKKFPSFSVEAENFESIHNHSAYAFVTSKAEE
jgi:GTP cyclohydrolase I